MMKMRTLIIDDMPLSRARTRRYLDDEPDIEIIGECDDGEAALAAISEQAPDLIFLDVQMPGICGFELLEQIPADKRPAVVFITAFDEFAVPAFEIRAIDYLLKPFDRERLVEALDRVRQQVGTQRHGEAQAAQNFLARLTIKSVGKTEFLAIETVDWIETAGNYLCVHAGGDTHLIRETMARLAARLDPKRFVRIHRSTIVRIDRIKAIEPLFNGDRCVTLEDGKKLTVSRSYRDEVDAALNG